jgi:hypothetical protein
VLVIPDGYVEPNGGGPGPIGYCDRRGMPGGSYYVVCGDTLGGIGRYYGVSWRYLQSRNGIVNANLIYAGQVIRP